MMQSARIVQVAARSLKASAVSTRAWSSFLYSFVHPRPQVRERWPGRVDLHATSRVAVFSHFDRWGRVQDFVHYYLRQIHDAGYAIVFVSAAPHLDPLAVEQLTPICGLILRRDNVGWDFGAYKAGIEAVTNLDRFDSLLLANDSVYGPFHDLGALIGRMNPAEADVWGITDSWERRFHLQSFFLLFGKTAVANRAFARFWHDLRYVQAKSWIIRRYEIGLTHTMLGVGLRCRALFPYRAAAAELRFEPPSEADTGTLGRRERDFLRTLSETIDTGIPLNPTHFLWETMISMGCPFLKRELLRDNPARIPGLVRWEKVVRSISDYDTDLIVRDLELSMRKRSV